MKHLLAVVALICFGSSVNAQNFGGPSGMSASPASSGFTAGQDVTGDDGVFKTLQSTGTAPNLINTGQVNKGSSTVQGDLRVDGSGLFGSSLTSKGAFTLSGGTMTLRPATDIAQLHLAQSNGDDGFLLHADAGAGDLVLSRRQSGSNSERFRILSGGGLSAVSGGPSTFGASVTVNGAFGIASGNNVNGALTFPSSVTLRGAILLESAAFTTRGGTITVRPATDVPQFHLQQSNGDDGWQFHADAAVGDLTFYRRESATNTERVRFPAGGSIRTASTQITSTGTYTASLGQTTARSCATGTTTNAAGVFDGCVASDRSLKASIASLRYNPKAIDSLRPVSYRWKKGTGRDAGEHIGFIAQEVNEVSPQAVISAGVGLSGIDPNAVLALVVKELQESHKREAALLKRVEALEKK